MVASLDRHRHYSSEDVHGIAGETTDPERRPAIRDTILSIIFNDTVLQLPKDDIRPEVKTQMEAAFKSLGVDEQSLRAMPGRKLHDARFVVTLYGMVLHAYGANRFDRFPDQELQRFDLAYITYLIRHRDILEQMQDRWTRTAQETGIITPFYPIYGNGPISEQIDRYVQFGTQVDVYSDANRYPLLFKVLKKLLEESGSFERTIIEFGTAALDNLFLLRSHTNRQVGIDIHPLETIINHPMMELRWKNDARAKAAHLAKIKASGIEFVQGSMFDEALVAALMSPARNPLICLYLSVLFHFRSDKIAEALEVALAHQPELIVIGGGLPGLGQLKEGIEVPGVHSRIFGLQDGSVELLAHVVDTSGFEEE